MSVAEILGRAADALERGDRVAGLDALVAAWRERRAPIVADVIDRLSTEIARGLPPIAGRTAAERHECWLDVARLGRAADLPRLVAMLDDGASTLVRERIDRLAARGDDPRLAAPLVAICERPRWTSSRARPVWSALFDLFERIGDARVRPRVDKILAAPLAASKYFIEPYRRRLTRVLDGLPREAPALDDDEANVLARCAEAIVGLAAGPPADERALFSAPIAPAPSSGVTREELLAMVWAAPDDDGPRRVLADFLLERGDPYGEFLTLQLRAAETRLKRADERRMKQLLKANLREWLGPLEAVVDLKSALFERGVLVRCTPRFRTAKQRAELIAHPAWSTVRELIVGDPEILLAPAFARVRRARGIDVAGLARLSSHAERPLALEALALANRDPVDDPTLRARIGDGRGLPALVELTVGPVWRGGRAPVTVEDWGWLLPTPLGARLRRLRIVEGPIYAESLPIGAWSRLLRRHPTVSLEAEIYTWSLHLAHGADGIELEARSRSMDSPWLPGFASCLRDVVTGDLSAIRVGASLSYDDRMELYTIVADRAPLSLV